MKIKHIRENQNFDRGRKSLFVKAYNMIYDYNFFFERMKHSLKLHKSNRKELTTKETRNKKLHNCKDITSTELAKK